MSTRLSNPLRSLLARGFPIPWLAGLLLGMRAADPATVCQPLRDGVSAWFDGESPANVLETGLGRFVGDAHLAVGHSGRGFAFDGVDDAVSIPTSQGLELQNLTVECWVRRSDPSRIGSESGAVLIAGNAGSWVFGINGDGALYLGKVGVVNVFSPRAVVDLAWHHVAVTREGSRVRFYLDGAPLAEAQLDVSFAASASYGIGGLSQRFDNRTYSFAGIIDDGVVYRQVLSEADIAADAALGDKPLCIDDLQIGLTEAPAQTSQEQAFTVKALVRNIGSTNMPSVRVRPLSDLAADLIEIAGSQGTVSPEQTVIIGDLPPGAEATVSARWRPKANFTGMMTNRLVLQLGSPDRIASNNDATAVTLVVGECSDSIPTPVAKWSGEGNALEQISGRSGALSPGLQFVPGKRGSAFAFRQGQDVVSFQLVPAVQLQEVTVACWIRRDSTNAVSPGANHCFFVAGPPGSAGFGLVPDGRLYLHRIPAESVFSTGVVTDTKWHHVAVTKSNEEVRFYIDGEPAGATAYSGTFSPLDAITFGGFASPGYSFLGDLDEVGIYSGALVPPQVSLLAALGGGQGCARDLNLSSAGIPASAATGDEFELGFLVEQIGTLPFSDVRLVMVLPSGMEFVSATSGQGTVSSAGGVIVGDLGKVAKFAKIPVRILLKARFARDYTLEARLLSSDPELTEANNILQARVAVRDFRLTVDPLEVDEGATGSERQAQFAIHMDPPRSQPIRLSYASFDRTASAGSDFKPNSGELTIPAGGTEARVPIIILGDDAFEDTEDFELRVSTIGLEPSLAVTGVGTIHNDDPAPVVRVFPGRWLESDQASNVVNFEVELSGPTRLSARFRWTTAGFEAREGSDYLSSSGLVELPPGQTHAVLSVPILGDNAFEVDESFLVRLSEFAGCRPAVELVRGIIVDDDPPPNVPARFSIGLPGPLVDAGRPFHVTITALDANGQVLAGFDGAVRVEARRGSGVPSRVVLSEVTASDNTGDFVEVANVSPDAVDISGWRVLLFGPATWPDPTTVAVVPDGTRLGVGQSLVFHQSNTTYPGALSLAGEFGRPWSGATPADLFGTPLVAVVLQDAASATLDSFAAGGADPAFLSSSTGLGGPRWTGAPVAVTNAAPYRFQRIGSANSRSAADWVTGRAPTPGKLAADLVTPQLDAIPVEILPSTVQGFVQGQWQGQLELPEPVAGVALYVDDDNGHTGRSAFFSTQGDLDHDGLPDLWEIEWGFSYRDAADAASDTDKDGFTALQEFLAGTNPRDAASLLQLTVRGDRMEWSAQPGRRYHLERRAPVDSGEWQRVKTYEPGEARVIAEPITPDSAQSSGAYRVVAEVP